MEDFIETFLSTSTAFLQRKRELRSSQRTASVDRQVSGSLHPVSVNEFFSYIPLTFLKLITKRT